MPGRSSSGKGESPAGPQGAQICPLYLHPSHTGSPSPQARALPSSPLKGSAGCHRRPSAPALTRARDMRFCRGQGTLQTCAQRWTSLVLWHCAVGEAGQQERVLAAGREYTVVRLAAAPGTSSTCPAAPLGFASGHPGSTPHCQGRRPQLRTSWPCNSGLSQGSARWSQQG